MLMDIADMFDIFGGFHGTVNQAHTLDITKGEDGYYTRYVEVPGAAVADTKLEIENRNLRIYYKPEHKNGTSVMKNVWLSKEFDPESIDVTSSNGVLTIRWKDKARPSPKVIAVKSKGG